MVGNFGFQQNYNLNITGGTERMSYFASIGMLNDGDIYNTKKQDEFDPRFYYKRYNWRTNFDFKLTKSTLLSVNIAGKMGYRNQPGYRDAGNGDSYIFNPFIQTPTNLFPIKYSDGEWGADLQGDGNIVAQMNNQGQRSYKSFQGFYDFILKQDLDMITKGLSVKATVSYNTYSERQSSIFRARMYGIDDSAASKNGIIRYYREYDYSNPIVNADGTIDYPMVREERFPDWQVEEERPVGASNDNFRNYGRKLYYEVALNYQRSFNDHNVTALAVFNRKITDSTDSGNNSKMSFASYEEDWVGRITYNWKERYLMEMNAAYTGSIPFISGIT